MGRRDFNQLTQIAALTAESVYFNASSSATPIDMGQSETIQVFAPAGYICEVRGLNLYTQAPNNVSGTYTQEVQCSGTTYPLLKGTTAYNKDLQYLCGEWASTVDTSSPTDKAAQAFMSQGGIFDSTGPLVIKTTNNMGAQMTKTRYYRILALKRKVG